MHFTLTCRRVLSQMKSGTGMKWVNKNGKQNVRQIKKKSIQAKTTKTKLKADIRCSAKLFNKIITIYNSVIQVFGFTAWALIVYMPCKSMCVYM